MKALLIVIFSFSAHLVLAKSSCDLYIQVSAFERSQQSYTNISNFFGFTNGKKDFDISLKKGTETQYWTTENGKTLEQVVPASNYRGKKATLELSQNPRGQWVFKLTIRDSGLSGSSKINEIVFESNPSPKRQVPDFAMTENSELIMTRSMTRSNPNSNVSVVIKQIMVFSKNSDGSIEWTNFNSTDSVRGDRILIGDETDYRLTLTER